MSRWFTWGLPLATLLSYAVLAGWFGPQVMAAAGGLMPFDLRLTGYTLAEAQVYLQALTPAGRDLYLGPIRVNDTIFPILFALTLWLPLRGRNRLLSLPALAYGLLDLAENHAVAGLLQIGPEVRAGAVAMASMLTVTKYAVASVAIALALWGLWRHRRQR